MPFGVAVYKRQITGEGKADRQTAMGKVPYGIIKEAQKEHIPVIVLAGSIENLPEFNKAGFKGIFSIAPGPITLEKAMEPEFAKENITRLVSQDVYKRQITATKGKYITLSAHGPLMKMTKTHYGLSGNGRTAIIEMAAISGLPLVPMEQRNPMLTTTFGTGELIRCV